MPSPIANPTARLLLGDCLARMAEIEDGSVDAIITDPPYPEIDRAYGRISEVDWHVLMRGVVEQSRRILKPSGSAVFILQPNSKKPGVMRPWLFEFQAWICREWNMVQDAWWWNYSVLPAGHAIQGRLMRPSVKACVWCGPPDCFRDQGEVLWAESHRNIAARCGERILKKQSMPSGHGVDRVRCGMAAATRGGVTPFNLLPIANANSTNSAGSHGHPAGTPHELADWWVRYISPPGGVVADPFTGSGTMGLAALNRGRSFIGIERDPGYFETATRRIHESCPPLFSESCP